ncbi:MAG: flagellar export chaperone FliS [Acidobacteriota bacterium]|nr:flagellar export chaperone FliS [Acidobacteriota bacterium]
MMTQQGIANHYQRQRARGASPVCLVVLLYDAAIESLRRAGLAAESGRIEQRVAASNHVVLVINELSRSLDHKRGGEIARNLDQFYAVARARLMEANLRADPHIFEELVGMFCSLREAWQQVEIKTAAPVNAANTNGATLSSDCESSSAGWSA